MPSPAFLKNREAQKGNYALDKAYAMCFSSPDGAKVLEHMEREYFAHTSPYKGEDTQYRCGQQKVILDILEKIRNGNT